MVTMGNAQPGAPAGCYCRKIVLSGSDVGNVERAVLAYPANVWLICTDLAAENGHGTKMSPRNPTVPLVESQHHVINPTNPGGALDDGVEDWLHVRRRAADDAKYFGRCCLMLQGFAQFCIALLDLLEQPHVLDGNHGLASESLQEPDLLVREWANFGSANHDSPAGVSLPHQRS